MISSGRMFLSFVMVAALAADFSPQAQWRAHSAPIEFKKVNDTVTPLKPGSGSRSGSGPFVGTVKTFSTGNIDYTNGFHWIFNGGTAYTTNLPQVSAAPSSGAATFYISVAVGAAQLTVDAYLGDSICTAGAGCVTAMSMTANQGCFLTSNDGTRWFRTFYG